MAKEFVVNFSVQQPKTMKASFGITGGGVKEHDKLENRDIPNQHPISAITNLETTLNNKQNRLNNGQLEAVNSGITSSKVSTYDGYATSKQDKLNQNQLSAVNSGITSQKVTNYDNYETTKQDVLSEAQQEVLDSGITSTKVGNYDSHITNKNNPHEVTKTQVGLGNVDNTSDLNKPISTATQSALDGKVSTSRTINSKALTSNITLTSNDVGALPNSTKYGASISLSIDSSTYVVTAQLKDQDGNNLGNAQTIDLPLESVVVNGTYDNTTKKVILTLQNGSTIEFSVADLVSGLQTEITSSNKLSADLVDDTSTTHKFVSSSDIANWNAKQDAISDLETIRSGASAGATAVQPSDLSTVATSGSYNDLTNKPTIPTVNNPTITIQKNGTTVDSFTLNQNSNKTINIPIPTTAADVGAIGLTDISIDSSSTNYLEYNNTNGKIGAKVDTVVTSNSTKLVTSGAVKTAIDEVSYVLQIIEW